MQVLFNGRKIPSNKLLIYGIIVEMIVKSWNHDKRTPQSSEPGRLLDLARRLVSDRDKARAVFSTKASAVHMTASLFPPAVSGEGPVVTRIFYFMGRNSF
jgi:hypothetical protein